MKLKYFIMIFCLLALNACEILQPYKQKQEKPVIIFNDPKPVKIVKPIDNAALMSNQNVIVYPVSGSIDQKRRKFPEYRGVMDNTTAGGYTVFDSSVTVFAVEGSSQRPSYLPKYSVPQYAEQYYETASRSTYAQQGSLTPMDLTPRAPVVQKRSPLTRTGERSKPLLTSY